VKLTSNLHSDPRLRMRGVVPTFPHVLMVLLLKAGAILPRENF